MKSEIPVPVVTEAFQGKTEQLPATNSNLAFVLG
jgi:hypothetical protein